MRTLKGDTMRLEFVFFITRLLCLQNCKTLFSLYGLPLISVMCRENIHTPPPPLTLTEGNGNSEGRGRRQKGGNFQGSLLKEVFFQGL